MAAKVVTVFGATGAQGGAVVEALSRDQGCHIRAVTRNPRAQSSAHLRTLKGVEVMEADMNDVTSLRHALQGADACFLVTVTYFRTGESNNEVQQGKNVADVCKELGIKQVVYSTVDPDWKQSTDIPVKELDQKIEIFSYMMSLSLPVIGVMPGFYYENILDVFKPRKVQDGLYGFGLPLEGACWGLASVQDLGPLVQQVLTQWKDEFIGEIIPLVTEILSLQEMSDVINRHIQTAQVVDLKLTKDQMKEALKKSDYSDEILRLFDVVLKSSTEILQQKANKCLVTTDRISFDQWVEENKELIETKVLS